MVEDERRDARLDGLYDVAPGEFTVARDELARALRLEGDRAAGAAVKKLRRPTVVAWALNQLARRHRDEVDELIDAGGRLRQAQRKAMSGLGSEPMRAAQRSRRAVVDRLTERAAAILDEQGSASQAHTLAVRRALEGASVDEQAADALLEGRLSQPPEAANGFGDIDGLSLVPAERAEAAEQAEGTDEAGAEEQRRRQALEEATSRLAEAEASAQRAADAAEAARREADEAAQQAVQAASEVARLARALDAARDEARRREERSRQAASRAREARTTADRCELERAVAAEEVGRLAR